MDATKYDMSPNPSDTANPISRLLFCWTLPMFKRGYSKVLEIGDLFGPKEMDKSDRIGDTLERHWNNQVERCADEIKSKNITDPKKIPKPSLTTALFYTFKWHFISLAFLIILNDVFIRLSIPILLGRLLPYFSPNPTATAEEAMGYAGGIVILNFLGSVVMNHYMLGAFHMGMRARVAVCSLIYRKSLKLSRTALGESAPGKVVNLLSNDVNRFDLCSMFLHYLWVGPLSSLLVMWFLFNEVGLSGVFGVIVIFTVMPLQAYTGKLSARFRLQTAIRTDERVRLMDEIISGVQVIKMYAWEKPFALLIRLARKLELAVVRKNSYVRAVYMSFLLFTTRASIFCTMASLMVYGDGITASKVFVFSSYFSVLSNTMSGMFVRAITETAEAMVSIKRLERYLGQDEYREKPITPKEEKPEMAKFENGSLQSNTPTPMDPHIAVKMTKATGKWLESSEEWTLENICLNIPKGKLVGVIGPVGAGKSSLLQAILGEMNLSSGHVQVAGSISYACQEPWVFGGTVRQNILFGLHYDKFRYNEVVRVCALQKDFQQFPHGDHTLVGERGASLSGGQKARINLARAVYRQSDVYLLDDPLSAVDAHVGKHLYEKCIGAHLKNKTRLLVTHQLHYLQDADIIVMMKDGKIELQGTYHELATSSLDYARMLIPQQEKVEPEEVIEESKDLNRDRMRQRRNAKRQNSVSSQLSFRSMSLSSSFMDLTEYNAEEDAEMEEKAQTAVAETSSKGMVEGSVGLQYAGAGGGKLSMMFVLFMFVATQAFTSMFDYFVSYWASQEELRTYYRGLNQTGSGLSNETNHSETGLGVTGLNGTTIETKLQPYESLLSTNLCMAIHGTLVSAILTVGLLRAVLFYNRCVKASSNLHDNMFRGIIRSPMKFFDENPSGRIMNRFSKDMGAIDEVLPKCTLDATQMILTIVGAVVVACIVNPIYLAFIAGLSVFFYFLRKVYLRTSKNIKRLEGMSRSPVFTHLGATLQGLPTIRASHAQNIIKSEFDKLQDTHTSAFYMFITTSSAFGFALDMLCLIFVSLVTFSFFLFDKETLGDQVGLAITQAMSLTFLMQYGVRQSAEVANQLMAVERLLEYTQLQPENGIGPDEADKRLAAKRNIKLRTFVETPRSWPEYGRIELRAMTLKYGDAEESQSVLKQLTCVIEPKEKVGIVGRTGAGKSSLIQALFRLAFVEGDIIIDGVNTSDITLEALRRQLSIIPQDPMLFSGTLRRNLDPFEEYSDQKLWQALEEVELKESFNNPSGLEMRVMDGGANFSVGQRQLVCLARALLRNNRILMMDEATANVDPHTDELIQQTIRTKFADCTVLTIAHRLNTIMDSDKVLVMDHGSIIEFAHPHELMEMRGSNSNEDGHFRKMVLETGPANTEKLAEIARLSYIKKYLVN